MTDSLISSSTSLAGLSVLVTRPREQGKSLCDAIEFCGGKAISAPLIEIDALQQSHELQAIKNRIEGLDNYQLIVFISTNAARFGAEWINNYWPQFPTGVEVMAIGPGTAHSVSSLLDCGEVVYSETGATSEDILRLPQLEDIAEKKILIVRGKGGREYLATSLADRGGLVDYLEVYQRRAVAYETAEFHQLLQEAAINVFIVTSGESLKQLVLALGLDSSENNPKRSLIPLRELLNVHLIVPSLRIAAQARELGFSSVSNAGGADDESCLASLQEIAANADKTAN